MAFMMKKKKYKFQVEVCLDELVEVPFVSAVLFAKVRLLDGGNFQEYSTREEVKEHTVKWGAHFEFPCKMSANASTGVLEPCVLRVSVRRECKGGRSYQKLGFCDLNLAELAGSGIVTRRCLLEGYDARHRQDNSMLTVTVKMNMLSGDILFKVPSPTTKLPTTVTPPEEVETAIPDGRTPDDYSGGSLAGSVASGSSGFGSLPKKRPALFTSELLSGQSTAMFTSDVTEIPNCETEIDSNIPQQTGVPTNTDPLGHSRNSSATSQMSRASGYSTQHSRQSSSGDSGHIRSPSWPVWAPTLLTPPFSPQSPSLSQMDSIRNKFWPFGQIQNKYLKVNVPNNNNNNSHHDDSEIFSTPKGSVLIEPNFKIFNHMNTIIKIENGKLSDKLNLTVNNDSTMYGTPQGTLYEREHSDESSSSELFKTPDGMLDDNEINEFSGIQNHVLHDLKKSFSCTVVEHKVISMSTIKERCEMEDGIEYRKPLMRSLTDDSDTINDSDFIIPRHSDDRISSKSDSIFQNFANSIAFMTPLTKRRMQQRPSSDNTELKNHSTPTKNSPTSKLFKLPGSPILKQHPSPVPAHRTTSLGSLKTSPPSGIKRNVNTAAIGQTRNRNPSSGSLALSETGSLDRAKAALERRKRAQEGTDIGLPSCGQVSGRVEVTRVNPDNLIAELLKATNLDQADESAETSGLQLFIAKDGTAALGNHEVKSQMSSGVQVFKQVVIEEKR